MPEPPQSRSVSLDSSVGAGPKADAHTVELARSYGSGDNRLQVLEVHDVVGAQVVDHLRSLTTGDRSVRVVRAIRVTLADVVRLQPGDVTAEDVARRHVRERSAGARQ